MLALIVLELSKGYAWLLSLTLLEVWEIGGSLEHALLGAVSLPEIPQTQISRTYILMRFNNLLV